MDTSIATFSVTDLRHKTNEILKETLTKGYAFIVRHSKPTVAVVDVHYLEALQEAHEEYLDVLEYDATVGLPRMSLEKHKKLRKT